MAKIYSIPEELSYSSVDDINIVWLISTVKKGIAYGLFLSLAHDSPFTMHEWSAFLSLSERTMQRYQKEKKSFDSIHSEKILQITLLCKFGIEVFGTKEKFNTWLETKNVALGGIKPKELLDNSFGIDLLKDELTRIEYGVLA